MDRGGLSAGEIAAMLNARVESLAPMLLQGGRKDGGFFTAGSVAGDAGQSLKVNLRGGRQGCWTDFSAAKGSPDYSGDMLTLIAVTMFGGKGKAGLASAIAWAKSWLGIDGLDPARIATIKRDTAVAKKASDQAAIEAAAASRNRAKHLWIGAVPIARTPAQSYLEARGIDFDRLGRIPNALRYRPDVWCDVRKGKYPAMVACIMAIDGALAGVHRTWLNIEAWSHATRSGPVTVVKIPKDNSGAMKSHKMSMGHYAGGCIPLWKGDCRKTLREIDAGTPVYISEGIEDGLSVAVALPTARIVAAVAISNMGGLMVPPQAGPLVFIGQNDAANSKAVTAFEGAVKRQQDAGRTVRMFFPQPEFKDFNDQLCGKRMAA